MPLAYPKGLVVNLGKFGHGWEYVDIQKKWSHKLPFLGQ